MEEMKRICDSSVDLVICDPPYGMMNGENKGIRWDMHKN
jgi:DNA modification methylase